MSIKNKEVLIFMVTILLIFLSLALKYSDSRLHLTGLAQMKNMAEFYPGGRTPVFFSSFIDRLANYQSGIALDYPLKFLIFVSLLMLIVQKKKAFAVPGGLWNFVFAAAILFIAANCFMYKLYGPSRYVRHPLPIFLIIFFSLNFDNFLEKIKSPNLIRVTQILFLIITFLCFMPKLKSYYIAGEYPYLYEFIQKLPKNIYIAGHPVPMDNIPTFAHRKVIINEETSEPYYLNYYPAIKKRTYDFFDAYYADSPAQVYDFCKKYGITHFVVFKSHFTKNYFSAKKLYLNPFNDYILSLVKNRNEFALTHAFENNKIFEKGDVFVLQIEK